MGRMWISRRASLRLAVFAWLALAGANWGQELLLPAEIQEDGKETPKEVEVGKADAKGGDGKAKECPNPWAKIPPLRVFPRLGYFFVPPTGPGYYSLLDLSKHEYREQPPRFPYGALAPIAFPFFEADFRYLEDPKNTQHDLFDCLHRIHLGDCWLFNTGGQFTWRHMHEINNRLTGLTNDYDLLRLRAYGDLWYKDEFRLYVEYLAADTFNDNLLPLFIDVNKSDFLDLFVDVKIAELKDKAVYVRAGRQELLFGSERLISPLDWANTRRTFQGVRAFRLGDKLDLDAFWVRPVVPVSPSRLDEWNDNASFAGAWATYRRKPGRFLDFYYLYLSELAPPALLGQRSAVPLTVNTWGARTVGDHCNWLWDVETMLQLGYRGATQGYVAGACTVSGGYHFKDAPLNPTFWLAYDYASGSTDPDAGNFSTFNQLFPFGHYYLGWLDLVGRQNIHDLNAHLWLYPTKWITCWLQYHHFYLDSARDALYSPGSVPLRRDPTGAAGTNVGDEIDLSVNFHLGPHSDIWIGYSHLFAGRFIQNTARTAAAARDPELFYAWYSFRW